MTPDNEHFNELYNSYEQTEQRNKVCPNTSPTSRLSRNVSAIVLSHAESAEKRRQLQTSA